MIKYVLLLLTGTALSLGSFAQNTFNNTGTNVGIGTLNPSSLLHVNNSMAISASSDGTNYYYQFQRPGDGWINSRIGNAYSFNAYGGELIFETNTGASLTSLAERMRIKFNGNVGIGTTSPNALLHINGTFLTAGAAANIDPGPTNALGQLGFLSYSSSLLIGWNRSAGAGETSFISNQGPGWGGGFAFYNHDNSNVETQLMYFRGDGTVSIGTDNTRAYKLAVNGNIRAKEIKVEADPWPDYVFNIAYSLMPIKEVELYINKNRHLPEMPSAQAVDKEGINLGEMNKVLVKKVEELTQYLIQQEKRIERLEAKQKRNKI